MRGSALIAHRCVFLAGMVLGAAVTAAAQDPPPPSIQLTLPAAAERWRAPLMSAAEQAAQIGRDWLGPHPAGVITSLEVELPVWQGRGAMVVERQAAYSVIRSWWPDALPDHRAAAILDGFAWYLQGQAIEQLFDRRHLRTAHSVETIPMFGGAVQWSVPTLRRSRWSAGLLRDDGGVSARYAAMFASLDRWIGTPGLQSAMFEVARMPPGALNAAAIVKTIDTATGQDLGWLFTAAGDPAVIFDYAIADLTSTLGSCGSPCFETSVTARRIGDGQFTGHSSARAGGFDAGDAITVRVLFENGETASAKWDGRDASRTFRFQGPSRAVSAHLDPDRVLVLDANYLNNHIAPATSTNAPVRKWMARWIVWMQNAVLSYGFFA